MMRPDKDKPYYTAYDKRYKATYEQGADYWGYLPEQYIILEKVNTYINRFALAGKRVIEFGCGQGITGLVFTKSGCIYTGYDISPAAIEKATALLSDYKNAKVYVDDVVSGYFPQDSFDAGIDIGCLHMLVTDSDRKKYLGNAYKTLKPESSMYFTYAGCRENIYDGEVTTYEQWLDITGEDVDTPLERMAIKDNDVFPVMISCIAARPRTERGYREELTGAGFKIIEFNKINKDGYIWADILTRKP